jgi:hypothetical protein
MKRVTVIIISEHFRRKIFLSRSKVVTPEDVDSKVLRNNGILPQLYVASEPRRP